MVNQSKVNEEGPKKTEWLSTEPAKKEPKPIQVEDEDEFEEFPRSEIKARKNALEMESELNVWTDNWDDENIEKDFHAMLKDELNRYGKTPTNF